MNLSVHMCVYIYEEANSFTLLSGFWSEQKEEYKHTHMCIGTSAATVTVAIHSHTYEHTYERTFVDNHA